MVMPVKDQEATGGGVSVPQWVGVCIISCEV